MTQYRLGIDIGGTFTDLVLYDKKDGSYKTEKILTTPKNLADGVLEGMENLVDDFKEIDYFVHGTTAGLNAFLERKGSNVALIVTKGFRDIYEIGRANRPDMYSIKYRKPEPLVKRRNIYEVEERVLSDGSVETSINFDHLNEVIDQIVEKGFNSVSISLLHAYKNPEHEVAIKNAIIEKAPQISVSLSHEIAREWREYERTSTTVINAYVAPIVENYLSSLEERTGSAGLEGDLYIMQSNGGVMTSGVAKQMPIQTLLSGPVGGAVGSITLGNLTEYKNLICVDMGGTSFDVSLVIDGEPDVTSETSLEEFPILTPMVNIHTIGAGGGSIAWIEGGGLRVGPKSAGSDPGPACYGNGGNQATVTDANLVLGRLDEDGFLGGNMKLDRDAAYAAVKDIADRLGLGVIGTAEGICDIANAKMADAIRTLTVSKGIDPRDFALVAFGGAGPMHAVLIADLLGIKKILVPTVAGTFSAWGMLQTDIRHDAVRTFVSTLNGSDKSKIAALYEEMEEETKTILSEQRVKPENMSLQRTIDLRYVGQEYTVNVPYQSESNDGTVSQLTGLFHEMHGKIHGHSNPDGMVEAVNIRITGYGKLEKQKEAEKQGISKTSTDVKSRTNKQVIWNGAEKNTPVLTSEHLQYGHSFYGPVLVDVAFGGSIFGIVDAEQFGLRLVSEEQQQLIALGIKIKKAANEQLKFQHPLKPGINSIDLIEFSLKSDKQEVDYRNTVVFGNGQIDRSPCGTGTCAKLALLHKQGKLQIGEEFVHESIINSKFGGRIVSLSSVGDYQAVIPQITGSAWVTGMHQFIIDSEDPFNEGFSLG